MDTTVLGTAITAIQGDVTDILPLALGLFGFFIALGVFLRLVKRAVRA